MSQEHYQQINAEVAGGKEGFTISRRQALGGTLALLGLGAAGGAYTALGDRDQDPETGSGSNQGGAAGGNAGAATTEQYDNTSTPEQGTENTTPGQSAQNSTGSTELPAPDVALAGNPISDYLEFERTDERLEVRRDPAEYYGVVNGRRSRASERHFYPGRDIISFYTPGFTEDEHFPVVMNEATMNAPLRMRVLSREAEETRGDTDNLYSVDADISPDYLQEVSDGFYAAVFDMSSVAPEPHTIHVLLGTQDNSDEQLENKLVSFYKRQ